MSKLNHARPNLRYLDNLKRELSLENRRTTFFDVRLAASKKAGSQPKRWQEFEKLSQFQRNLLGNLFDRYGAHMATCTAIIASLGKKGGRRGLQKKLDDISDELAVLGALLASEMIDETIHGSRGAWSWFKAYHKSLTRQQRGYWESFHGIFEERSLQLFALYVAKNEPDHAERIQAHFGITK